MVKVTNKRAVQKKSQSSTKRGITSSSMPLKRNTSIITRKPIQKMTRDGIMISHREYVGPLMSSATPLTFSIDKQFKLNPGYTTVFPWLAQVARNYESYRFNKCNIVVQNYMSSMRDGIVNYCVDYDSGDAAPQSLQEMLSNRTAGSKPVGAPFSITLDVAALNKVSKQKFVRANDTDVFDTLLYESGSLYFNASLPLELATRQVANIFIEYDIELKTPQVKLSSSTAQFSKSSSAKMTSSTPNATPLNKKNGMAEVVPLGEVLTDMIGNNVSEYASNVLQNYANTVLGGTGQNIIPNIVNAAAQIFRVADISTERTTVGGTFPIDTEFVFTQLGFFHVQLCLQRYNPTTSEPFFVDSVTMESTAGYAVAQATYAGLWEVGVDDEVFDRVQYDFCVDIRNLNENFIIRQLGRVNPAYPAQVYMAYKLIGLSITPLSNQDFSYAAVLGNELVAVSGVRGLKALAFEGGKCYGLHSEMKLLDDHKFMAFDKSTPTSLGKHRVVIEDYLPTPHSSLSPPGNSRR